MRIAGRSVLIGFLAMEDFVSKASLHEADPLCEEALGLLKEMRAEALCRYADVIDPSTPPPTNTPLVPRSAFFITRLNAQTVGCAAFCPIDAEVAEIKRMYVISSARRRGIGRLLLAGSECAAFEIRLPKRSIGDRCSPAAGDCTLRILRLSTHPAIRDSYGRSVERLL